MWAHKQVNKTLQLGLGTLTVGEHVAILLHTANTCLFCPVCKNEADKMGVKEGVLDRKSNIYFFLQLQEECLQHTSASLDQQLSMHGRKGRKESDWLQGTCPGPQRKHSVMSSQMTFWCRYWGRNVCERQPGQTPRPNTENIPEELVTPGKSNYRTYLEFQTIFNFWQRKCLSLKEAKKK